MYLSYFGFREHAFRLSLDARFCYSSRAYEEAYQTLRYGIESRKGLMVLLGEVGSGKSLLLRRLIADMSSLTPRVRFAYVSHSLENFEQLIDTICQEFSIEIRADGLLHKIEQLNAFLLDELEQQVRVAVLIDEAHTISVDVLSKLRLLSNLETDQEKLLQIILAGQPEFQDTLDQHRLRQLKQRIVLQARLDLLAAEDVPAFVAHRIRAAGHTGPSLFSARALARIAAYSQGVPRLIVILCDNSLRLSYLRRHTTVAAATVEQVAQELRLSAGRKSIFSFGHMRRAWPSRMARLHVSAADLLVLRGPSASWVGIFIACVLVGSLALAVSGPIKRNPTGLRDIAESAAEGWRSLTRDFGSWAQEQVAEQFAAKSSQSSPTQHEMASKSIAPGTSAASASPPRPIAVPPALPASPPIVGSQLRTLQRLEAPPANPIQGQTAAEQNVHEIRLQAGQTVSRVLLKFYGSYEPLVFDVVKDYNPHIENLDHVNVGETLRLPPVSKETLLRQQADGTYRLVLAAFRHAVDAQALLAVTRQQGLAATLSRRKVADTLTIYRVEVSGLRDAQAIERAWAFASP